MRLERITEERVGEKESFCPTCDQRVRFSVVRLRRKRALFSVINVSTKDMGAFLVCPSCGGRFPIE